VRLWTVTFDEVIDEEVRLWTATFDEVIEVMESHLK
jgi:hypothetical protein